MIRKVLIVDDDAINRHMLHRILSEDYEIWEAEDGAVALEILRREGDRISAVLLDIIMPGIDGYEVLRTMRAESKLKHIPVLVASGSTEKDVEVKVLALGANDFVTKPYRAASIKHRLWNAINLREAMADARLAQRDYLTGLYNRKVFFEKAAEMIAAREPGYYVMACFDVDNFKVINDQYGTAKGDQVLRLIADTFAAGFAPVGGICCRVMADNFAVLYPRELMDSDDLAKIRDTAAALDGSIETLTFSIGRYIVDDLSLSVSGMYDRAALAEKSAQGRFGANIALYDESMRTHLLREQEIIGEMQTALEEGQFEVWYQPQYNHATGALIGAEALVRWRHPHRGLISPNEFIPVFERNGFIYELDKYVWKQTCALLREWSDEGRMPLPVSVNISRNDVFRDDLIQVITGLIASYRLPVELLRLEITESAFAKSTEQIIRVVKQLINYGFTVEIDDFGSGYSSLNTLKDVPAQVLKLDMRFLENSENSSRGGNVLESVVRMARWLGMSVIAEGVETLEQADYMESIGCHYVQGFLYAQPMPREDYEALAKGVVKEEKMIVMETVETLDNSAFWDPKSMDTLIFNSFVGGACIFEYHDHRVEMLRANKKYAQAIGGMHITLEQAFKINWREHLDPQSRVTAIDAFQRAIATNDEATCEVVFHDLTPERPHTYMRMTVRVIARTGDHYLFYCMNEDITEQRVAERGERELSERLRAIMDNINGGITAVITQGDEMRYLFANNRYYELLGYTPEQYRQEVDTTYDVIHPEDRAMVWDFAEETKKAGSSSTLEYRAIQRDGTEIWLRELLAITRFDGIDFPVELSIFSDITVEKQAEQKLKATDEQLRFLNEVARDLLAQADTDAGINEVLQRVLHYFDGDRAYVLELNPVRRVVNNTYEVCAPGVNSEQEFLQEVPFEVAPFWYRALEQAEIICIEDVDALDASRAEEQEMLREQGIRSLIAAPLLQDGALIGFFGVDDPRRQQSHVGHLQAIGDYLVTMLARRDLTAKIESERENLISLMNDTPGGFARLRVLPSGFVATEHVNDTFCRLRGMTSEEIIAADREDAMSTVHPDDMELVRTTVAEMIATGEARNIQYRLKHGNGEYVPFTVFGRVSRNKDGEFFINAYYADISEREKRELTVRDTMPYILSAIMEYSNDLVFAKDKDFRYICCSPAFVKFTRQQTQDDVIGHTDYEFFTKEEADHFRGDDERLFRDGEPLVDYVEPIPSDDGIQHYCSTSKYLLRDATGAVIGMYGIGRDITETRLAFEQLKLLTDSIPGGLATYTLSADGLRITYFNDGLCSMLGYTREEYEQVTQEGVITAVFAEDVPRLQAQMEEMIAHGTPVNCTYRVHTRQDGGHKWVNLRLAPAERQGDSLVANAVLFDVTEQKAAEEAARIHGEEMKVAMSQMGKMICEYDSATRTLTMPEAYARQYNMPHELSDIPDNEARKALIDPECHPAYHAFYDAILRRDPAGEAEIRIRRADDSWHWEHLEFSTIFDLDGKPVKTIIAVEDTTQQHLQYELEQNRPTLGEENLLFHALFNLNTGETLDYAYRDGSPVPPEQRTALLYGGDNLNTLLIDQEERARYRELNDPATLLRHYEKGETELSHDYRRRMPNGDIIWVRDLLHMIREPGGSDILLFEYCYNIDEEKTQEMMYDALVNEGYDYVARINGRNRNFVIIANAGVKHAIPPRHGDDVDAAVRELAEKYIHPEDREMVIKNIRVKSLKKNLAKQERVQLICRLLRPNGELRYKKFTAYYLDRERDIIIVTREDVSAVVRDEMRKNEQLADALHAANQANQAKSQFLSRMSHELRTPMNAIIGLSALSATEVNDPKAMEDAIGKIGMSARYLLSLINDILEMSRIESGRMTLSEEPFGFEQFITEVNTIIYAQAEAKSLDYDAIVNGYTEPSYVGDVTKLQQILLNILGNAVKFTPPGGKVTLAIEQLRRAKKRATLRFTVTDTGIGIEEEFLSRMFEPFAQEDTDFNFTGTGLGLAITKNLVEMMSGQISVKSIKNIGSVFTIDVQLGISRESRQYLDMVAAMNLSKLRALVVDDDVVVCQSTESILKAMGMLAEWVDSGRRAVERVREAHAAKRDFDTIFIDWKMPDMDGIETTRRIRGIVGPDVTIIIMTAYDWKNIETEAREAGVDMFMEKPLFQSSIVKAFERVFRAKREKVEPAPPAAAPDLSGKRILLAEDHPLNVEVARRLLEKVGAEVTVVGNGLEAIETFATEKDGWFNAILMDIQMPVMDGLTATKAIRNLRKPGARDIPIIAMTANAFDQDVQLSLSSGMNAHLTKPIEPLLMYVTLQNLMRD